jgi:hypothetical protein
MRDLLLTSLAFGAGLLFVLRRFVHLLREALELRNEWHRRERYLALLTLSID